MLTRWLWPDRPLISGGSSEATGFLGHNGFEFKNLHAVRNEASVINGHGVTRRALRERESSGEPLEGFTRRRGWTAQRLRWWQRRLGEWKEGGLGGAMLAPVVTITGVHDGRR